MARIADKLRILVEWSPVVALVQDISGAKDNKTKTLAVMGLLEFLSSKTPVRFDDELIAKIEAILLTNEGMALVDWIAAMVVEFMDVEANMTRMPGYEDA
jgi:hypothetical protein